MEEEAVIRGRKQEEGVTRRWTVANNDFLFHIRPTASFFSFLFPFACYFIIHLSTPCKRLLANER